jgi:iron complex transport system substrate-binding protein
MINFKTIAASCALLSSMALSAQAGDITGSRGTQSFAETPTRIATLSWALTELLVELDGPLIAVADIEGYNTWVVKPALPDGLADTGLRTEPNLEFLAEQNPDLILISDEQISFVEQLERIAPVVHFELYDAEQNNAEASRAAFLEIAQLLGEIGAATTKLAALDAGMLAAGERVKAHFGDAAPQVLPIRLLTETSLRLHGTNSMAMAALSGMGLEHAQPGNTTSWGFVQRRVKDLAEFESTAVVHIDPFAGADELYSSATWKFMPFVQADRYAIAEPSWTFGGVFSTGYLADAFADALIQLQP